MTQRLPRYWWYSVMAVSAAAAAVLSFTAWRDLALYTGGDPATAWWLPIAIDIAAAGALTAYVLWADQFAHMVAVVIVAVSATGNAFSHRYRVEASGIETVADGWMVTAVWTLPPLVLYVNSQLYARKLRKDGHAGPVGSELVEPVGGNTGDPAPDRRAVGVGGTVGSKPRRSKRAPRRVPANSAAPTGPHRTDAELVQEILDHQGWGELSGDKLASLLHVAKGRALDARKLARETAVAHGNGNATLVE